MGIYMEIKINVNESLNDIEVVISGNDLTKMTAIAKQLQTKTVETHKFVIKTADDIHVVAQSDILIVESFGNDLSVTLKQQQQLTTRKTLKQFLSSDTSHLFVQISRSMAINLNALVRMESAFSGNYYAFLTDGTRVTVSRRFIKNILNRLEGRADNETV